MPVDEAPDDDSVRQSYNFAPGYYGLVYRADGPDRESRTEESHDHEQTKAEHGTSPVQGHRDSTKYSCRP
jgi:hypothetical protein